MHEDVEVTEGIPEVLVDQDPLEEVDSVALVALGAAMENQDPREKVDDLDTAAVCQARYIVIQQMGTMDPQDKKESSSFIQQERSHHDVVTN